MSRENSYGHVKTINLVLSFQNNMHLVRYQSWQKILHAIICLLEMLFFTRKKGVLGILIVFTMNKPMSSFTFVHIMKASRKLFGGFYVTKTMSLNQCRY